MGEIKGEDKRCNAKRDWDVIVFGIHEVVVEGSIIDH